MGEEHVGSMVSVDCGSVLGIYEGIVLQVDSLLHTLTLKDPKRNGVVYPVAKVTLRAADIHDLKIIKLRTELGSCGNGNGDGQCEKSSRDSNKSPRKQIHHSKSFQNTSTFYKSNNTTKATLQRRRSQTPEPPSFSNDCEYNNVESFNDYPDELSANKHRAYSGGNQFKLYNANQNNFLLNEPLDLSEMDDDFDFEANLALFDKLEVKNLCDSLKIPDRPKKNYRHDEFVIDNPADVYSSAKNSYKYLTETGASVCALSKKDKNQLFQQKVRCDKNIFDKFLHLYAFSAVQCVLDAIGSKPSYENLAALFIIDASASSIVRDLANETKNHFENKLIDITFLNEQKIEISDLHSKKFDFVLVFGLNATNFRSIDELCTDQTLIVVEIDSDDDFSAKKFSTKFKSCIFWHLPVSDCDVKSSSIYLCDVGLNPKNVAEMFRLKKYQDPFGAKSFVKLLKM